MGGSRHFGLGGGGGGLHSGRSRKILTKILTPLGGSGGMPPPQEIFDIFMLCLRQLLVRSEANILPQIAPEILGDRLNLNGIWCLLPFKFLDMYQKPSRNSQTDLKISSIEDTQSGRLCQTSFQKPPPPPNLPLLCCTKTPFNVPLQRTALRMCLNENLCG